MRDFSGEIAPLTLRYLPSAFSGQNPAMIWLGLQLYWLLGSFALRRPRCLPRKFGAEDVVSLRCGVRPLAVPRNYAKTVYPLELSRRHCVAENWERQILSVYGGKLTSSRMLAEEITAKLQRRISPRHTPPIPFGEPPSVTVPLGLNHECVTPEWARDAEFCMTLEDYLRRRTPISQWIPRMGFGKQNDHRKSLHAIAQTFAGTPEQGACDLTVYEDRVRTLYDPLFTA